MLVEFYKHIQEFTSFKSPIDRHLFYNHVYRYNEGHFNELYKEWTMRRINKVLDIFGVDYFKDKKILVLGDGIGNISSFFASISKEVVTLDKRHNINYIKLRYRDLNNLKPFEFDLRKDFRKFGKFDLIINFGLIEVMEDFTDLIKYCCDMSNSILVETLVLDTNKKDKIIKVKRIESNNLDLGMTNIGSYPSPFLIEKLFEDNGFKTKRYFDGDLNSRFTIYDWKPKFNDRNDEDKLRRFWLFEKEK